MPVNITRKGISFYPDPLKNGEYIANLTCIASDQKCITSVETRKVLSFTLTNGYVQTNLKKGNGLKNKNLLGSINSYIERHIIHILTALAAITTLISFYLLLKESTRLDFYCVYSEA